MTAINMMDTLLRSLEEITPAMIFLALPIFLALSLVITWGTACVLLVGKRLMEKKAGRTRSSFKAVRTQAKRFVITLFLTDILRGCFIFFWSLIYIIPALFTALLISSFPLSISGLTAFFEQAEANKQGVMVAIVLLPLLIPAIMYSIRTTFYYLVVVLEGKGYRQSLQRSKKLVDGKVWTVLWYLLVLGIVCFLPANILSNLLAMLLTSVDPQLFAVNDLIESTFGALASTFFLLTTIIVYGSLKKAS